MRHYQIITRHKQLSFLFEAEDIKFDSICNGGTISTCDADTWDISSIVLILDRGGLFAPTDHSRNLRILAEYPNTIKT